MVEFWKSVIYGLYKEIYQTPLLSKLKIKNSLRIERIIPLGIDNILQELVNRNILIPIDAIFTKQFYNTKEKSWGKKAMSKLYQGTLGIIFGSGQSKPLNDSSILVNLKFLNVKRLVFLIA